MYRISPITYPRSLKCRETDMPTHYPSHLSAYIRKCLTTLKIETIEDILRYALKNGLDSLLDLPGFGALGLAQLKFQLESIR